MTLGVKTYVNPATALFNTGRDPVLHKNFVETAMSSHLSLRDGVLQSWTEEPVDDTRPVEWAIKGIALVSGEKIAASGRISPQEVCAYSQDDEVKIQCFNERMAVNFLGEFWHPVFAEKVLILLPGASGDTFDVWRIEPGPKKSVISRPQKGSYDRKWKWLFVS